MSNVQNQHKQCKLHQRRISEIDVEFGKMDLISTNNANYIYVEILKMDLFSTNNANYINVECSKSAQTMQITSMSKFRKWI